MVNTFSKSQGFVRVLRYSNFYNSLLLSTSPVHTSLTQAVTSQAQNREPLNRVFTVIMPKYLFEIDGFRINIVNLIEEKYNINYKLGFGSSVCDVTGSVQLSD